MKNYEEKNQVPQCDKNAVICSACGSKNSIRWEKKKLVLTTKTVHIKTLRLIFVKSVVMLQMLIYLKTYNYEKN
jgi:hypothetical protein